MLIGKGMYNTNLNLEMRIYMDGRYDSNCPNLGQFRLHRLGHLIVRQPYFLRIVDIEWGSRKALESTNQSVHQCWILILVVNSLIIQGHTSSLTIRYRA